MLLVSYSTRGSDGPWRAGISQEHQVIDALAHPSAHAEEAFVAGASAVRRVLNQGPEYLTALFQWADQQFAAGTQLIAGETVEIGPPVPDPDKIICLGVNYREHAAESEMTPPVAPMFFAKFRNSLVGPESPIILPAMSHEVDYEGELAAIIGTRCKAVAERDALRYVAGYSIMHDVSARDLQMQTSQWMGGKALDTFAPMGPGIAPTSAIPDPQALRLITRLNGQEVQHDSTGNMIFSVAAAIAFLSSLMTLEPGDIIATGTPSGVGFKRTPPLYLQDGDIAEIEIERIGILRNPVVRP